MTISWPARAGRISTVLVVAVLLGLAATSAFALSVTRGPYLQMGDDDSIVIRWRTDTPSNSRVRYGTSVLTLNERVSQGGNRTEHEIQVTGLLPGTRYFYSVGSSGQVLAGGDSTHFFDTAPPPGTPQTMRIWVLGDSGTADANAAAVRDAYLTHTGNLSPDLMLMLGDNAYPNGTDSEYQAALFDMYPQILRNAVLWPTLGNHDGSSSSSSDESGPYFDMFTLPRMGEVGGVISGTEAYYSFDYANVHFIVLDSQGSLRTEGSPMLAWLQNDLAMTPQDWIIAYWHHPPYSKGSHDSDDDVLEFQLVEMRENAVQILESFGVDLVLTGHSHSYERSFLIDGHYGESDTFGPEHVVDGGDGRETGDGAYTKPLYGGRQGTVYTVAGSSGKTTGGSLDHPAMFVSLNELGSVILDIAADTLDATFLNSTGDVRDSFTLIKSSETVVEFSAVPSSGAAPLAVEFTDESLIEATAWAWDFEDDGTIDSSDQHPTAVYELPGTYSVKLTVTAQQGVFERVKTDFVVASLDPPLAEFTSNVQIGAAPLTVDFTDLSSQIPVAWEWDFDNDLNIDSTVQNPSWTFTEPGSYTVSLSVNNPAGSTTEIKTDFIVVTPLVPGEITNLLFDTDPTVFFWDAPLDACSYDVVKGDLVQLRSGNGQFETAQLGCAAQQTPVPEAEDASIPAPGQAFFYVVRGVTCSSDAGTYDTSNPFQLQSRDLPLQGPTAACGCNPASDFDGDGFCDPYDLCPTLADVDQTDSDGDGFGDACDCDPLSTRCTTDCTDADADSYCLTSDCDDQSSETFPGAAPNDDPAACMADEDQDDWGDATPLPLVTAGTDCDDTQAAVNPTSTWYADFDADGFGDPNTNIVQCDQPVGWVLEATDCDGTRADTFPGAAPADDPGACMKDADGDGWGDSAPAAGVTPGADCDDDSTSAASAFPGAAPNDDPAACMKDVDGDDWGDDTPPAGVVPGTDCDDADPGLTPVSAWYADTDGDGFGDLFVSLLQCLAPAGHVADSTDCDDVTLSAAVTFPGAAPSDDALACMKDADGDGWGDSAPLPGVAPGSDCDDDDSDRGPNSVWFADADADTFGDVISMLVQCEQPAGYVFDNTDCDDSSATAASTFPGAAPNDNPSTCMKDADGDDWGDAAPPAGVSAGTDCDDDSASAGATFPGAAPNDGPGCLLDADADGWGDATPPPGVPSGTDCDDADAAIDPDTVWYRDQDLDGFGDVAVSLVQCEQPAGHLLDSTDCDDTSPTAASTFRGAAPGDSALACMKDVDGDDFGDSSPPAGVIPGSDCDDDDAAANIHTPWYADTDGDGFGDPAALTESCIAPAAHVSNTDDCDDTSPTAAAAFPGAAPNDSATACMKDADGDGWGDDGPPAGVTPGSDCDDDSPTAASTFPGAAPSDNATACMKDADGDGWGDDGPPAGVTPGTDCNDVDDSLTPQSRWYADSDGDGYGNLFVSLTQCDEPAGYVIDSTDCDDLSASATTTFPGAAPNDDSFVCMKDTDNDDWGDDSPPAGVVPGSDCADDDPARGPTTVWFSDADGDGFGNVGLMLVQCDQPAGYIFDNGDCDDLSATAASTFPGAAPNDGPSCMKDVDGDDWGDLAPLAGVGPGTDCDDDSPSAASTFPGAAPSDGPGCLLDADDDDWGDDSPPAGVPSGTDCDDADAEIHPATNWYRDLDSDGFGDVAEPLTQCEQPAGYQLDSTDCDDTSPTAASTFPGAAPNDSDVTCMKDSDSDDWGDLSPIAGVTAGSDCDDADPTRNPTTVWFGDSDGDGFGDAAITLVQCAQPAAHVLDNADCDDTSATAASTFPGAAPNDSGSACMKDADGDGYGDLAPPPGVTNGSDCDDSDQILNPATRWYADNDGDGYGDPSVELVQCLQPAGYLLDNTDCDDVSASAASTYPGAAPNDGANVCLKDVDGDDWGDATPPPGVPVGGDCDDNDAVLNPATLWHADADFDGFGDVADQRQQCPQPPGFVLDATDCDDASATAASTFPGAAPAEVNGSACMRDVDGDDYGDLSPPGGVVAGTDCADGDVFSNPGAPEVCDGNDNNCDTTVPLDEIDNDGDFFVECTAWNDTQNDSPSVAGGDDCDDTSATAAATFPGAAPAEVNGSACMRDVDSDDYGDAAPPGGIVAGTDCADGDVTSHPGAAELCDGNDNNCDTVVPADEIDADGDLYVECTSWSDSQGDQPMIDGGDDCDDGDSASRPDAAELCDGNDNDCDTVVPADEIDNDGDLYVECTGWDDTQGDQLTIDGGDDCDDADSASNPGASEVCDGNDNDCDTVVPLTEIDNDGDLYVECASWSDSQADQPTIDGGDDCDDADSTSRPGAAELCDGNDNDCDTVVPADEIDNDGDLYVECATWSDSQADQPAIDGGDDCDDADSTSRPGGTEVCDGNDNDCDTVVPLTEIDNDGDLHVECATWSDSQGDQPTIVAGGDCDDADSTSRPGGTEVCDGNDNDCDTVVPLTEIDNDGDLYVDCTGWDDTQGDQLTIDGGGDCDDADSASKPGGTEVCDGNDNDCDTVVPLDEIDNDGDLYVECTGWNDTQSDQGTIVGGDDCDDTLSGINPGATEIVGNGTDEDCNGFDTVRCYTDGDGDTYGDSGGAGTLDADGSCDAGSVLDNTDCDDADSASKPGGTEVCDGNDNDCDTVVPLDEIDNDGDLYVECEPWSDTQSDQLSILGGGDCDDTDSASKPGGTEVCDGNDNDCDTVVPLDEIDNDGDLYVECTGWNDTQSDQGTIAGGDDCDDVVPGINPGATEIVGNGTDEDCNGFDTVRCYTDGDGDTYGDSGDAGTLDADGSCDTGKVLDNTDCADGDSASNPGASEVCDGNDNNCDTVVPATEIDNDGDLYVECEPWSDTQSDQLTILGGGDCDDADSASKPGGTEVCDGNDNDCDTVVPLDEIDNDGDLYVECTGWNDTQSDQGTIVGGDDCDDVVPGINPGATEIVGNGTDEDCNGFDTVRCYTDGDGDTYGDSGDAGTLDADGSCDAGSVLDNTDCDDADSASKPGGTEVCDGNDNDCDTVVPLDEIDNDGDLYVECEPWNDTQSDQGTIIAGGDCDDVVPGINPGATEIVGNGTDEDCNGFDTVRCYTDGDGDTYGDSGDAGTLDADGSCDSGKVLDNTDCADGDSASNPGASEVCDGNDNDCDTTVPLTEIDNDGDLYVECTGWNDTQSDQGTIVGGDDCDDVVPGINPGATEIVGNGTDEDCNGFDTVRCYTDGDGDTFGDSGDAGTLDADGSCDAGSVLDNTDCDDADSASKPGGTEVCDGNDNDCDTVVPLDEIDNDGDLYVECEPWSDTQSDQLTILGGGDCDDADSASKPGGTEVCDGNDNDCDTVVPATEIDNDGDLYVECEPWNDTQSDQGTIIAGGDCDDVVPGINPGATEIVGNGTDEDCNGFDTVRCYTDGDGDTYGDSGDAGTLDADGSCDAGSVLDNTDCDDADSASKPGGTEVCDGNDNDCDTVVPLDEIDNDGDLYVECEPWSDTQSDQLSILGGGDCDDTDSASKPGGTEVCDGNDNDCDTVVPLDEIDNDGDLYVECTGWNDTQSDQGTIAGGDDCDDVVPGINPGATEIVGNGTDEDCNGFDTVRCYTDGDGDTYGDSGDAGTLDADGSCDTGKVLDNTDCADGDSASNPGASEVCDGNDNNCDTVVPATEIDNDGDLYVECEPWSDTQSDQLTILGGGDCDDADSASKPGGTEVCDGNDNDCDTVVPLDEIDNDGDLYVECTGWNDTQSDQGTIVGGDDCDDVVPGINPGATEIVGNGTDEDCNGFDTVRCYTDGDGDTYGDSGDAGTLDADGSCDSGKVLDNTDCADGDSASNPGASEVCDGNDNNCDTTVPLTEIDNDGDLYVECTGWNDTQSDQGTIVGGDDCDDVVPGINPGATEIVGNGTDEDCNGFDTVRCYTDGDGDTYGDSGDAGTLDADGSCDSGKVLDNTDCADGDSASNPGASEVCDGNDNNCDTTVPLTEIDNDGDLYVECTGWNDTQSDQGTIVGGDDCDDVVPGINPGATEIVGNGTDEDCNGFDTVRCYTDGDGDTFGDSGDAGTLDADGSCDAGSVLDNTDCDDADSASKPGGTEVCDGNDNDCDTVVPLDEIDNDGDLYVECTGWNDTQSDQGTIVGGDDCDDVVPGINPGATEIVGNGTDEDCNGFDTVRCYTDGDGDTYGDSGDAGTLDADGSCDSGKVLDNTDCADGDSASNPGASEVCDGNDNNCDTTVPLTEIDNDGDLYVECTGWNDTQSDQGTIVGGDDCDDTLSGINPGATEIVGNGTDEDCNGFDTVRCYTDADGDTFGDSADTGTLDADGTCDSGKVLDNTDCDDTGSTAASIFPGAAPNETNSAACMEDVDDDGYGDETPPAGVTPGTDCNDADAGVFPGAGC